MFSLRDYMSGLSAFFLFDITGLVQACSLLSLFCLQDKENDLCAANVKVQQLEAELQDLSSQESKDEASLAKVKKQLRDIEAKVKDQEEELDEQAGTIQMLEQVKVSLTVAKAYMTCRKPSFVHLCCILLPGPHHILRPSCGLRWRWRGSGRPTPKRLRAKMKRWRRLDIPAVRR